jgi:hypothetical protein
MTKHRDSSLVYNQVEAAQLIHPDLAWRTMERWRRNGTGPRFVRIGRRIGYTREAIEDWLVQQSRQRTAEK